MRGSTPSDRRSTAQGGATDFIRQIIRRDLEDGTHGGRVVTRFPPEPNGFLHIGHAKSIVLNFGIAQEHEQGRCHLRFDDTNPLTEDERYVRAIQEDVAWLGYDWGEHLYFASDYFEAMYRFAEELVEKGLAYVDSQTEEEIREGRGTVTRPGTEGPWRDRPVEENLELFRRMRAGEFEAGEHVLRAKIDMTSPNMLMRDPVLYRILHADHYRTGDRWRIYPLYDFAHPLEDALEGVTHSLCTLEFDNNREVYDWVVEHTSVPHRPRQYEFARLNLDYTVMSKRKLLRLVREGDVSGWDDPRMPTVAGLRRRGVTPEAIRAFCEMVGVAKTDSRVDMAKLEYAIRDDLNRKVPRVLCVLRPLRVVLTNWPDGKVDELEAPLYPHDVPLEGTRRLPFSGEVFIDRDDFAEDPPAGFRRLVPGGEVRLRYGYVIRCEEVVKSDDGEILELRCTVDLETRGGSTPHGRKVKGTIHWVSGAHAVPCEVRLYDRLFTVPDPNAAAGEADAAGEEDPGGAAPDPDAAGRPDPDASGIRRFLNPDSLEVVEDALVEPSVLDDRPDARYQFERVGYFWRDPMDSRPERPVFNRIVTLRDTWAKVAARKEAAAEEASAGREEEAEPAAGPGTAPGRGSAADARGPAAGEQKEGAARGKREEARPSALPPQARARADTLRTTFGLGRASAEILARDPALDRFYRSAVDAYPAEDPAGEAWVEGSPTGAAAIANWIVNELPPVQGDRGLEDLPFGPVELAELVSLVEDGTLSSRGGRELLERLAKEGGAPRALVDRLDLEQVSDPDVLAPMVTRIVERHPDEAKAYMSGKKGLIGFFIGQLMRETRGKADPELARRLLEEALGG
jgi:glutaminyl-tRNA synthetase